MIESYIELNIPELGIIEFVNHERTMRYLQLAPWRGGTSINDCNRVDFSLYPDSEIAQIPCDPGPYWLPPECNPCMLPPTPIENCEQPWADSSEPGATSFLGGIVSRMTGFDNTTSRELKPLAIGDGSSWGNYQQPGRCIIFDMCVFAKDECGLEYGIQWYQSILDTLAQCTCDASMFMLDCCPQPGTLIQPHVKELKNVSAQRGIQVLSTAFNKTFANLRFTICSDQPYIYDCDCVESPAAEAVGPVENLGKPPTIANIIESTRTRCDREICLLPNGSWCKSDSTADWEPEELVMFGGSCNPKITNFVPYTPPASCTEVDTDADCDNCCPCTIKLKFDGRDFTWEPMLVGELPPSLLPCDNRNESDLVFGLLPNPNLPDCDCPVILHEIWFPAPPGTLPRPDQCEVMPNPCVTVQTIDIDLGSTIDFIGPYTYTAVDFVGELSCACPVEIRNITYNDCGDIVTIANPPAGFTATDMGILINNAASFLVPGRDQVLFNKEVDEVHWEVSMCAMPDEDIVWTSASSAPPAGGEPGSNIADACCCIVSPVDGGGVELTDYDFDFHGIPPLSCTISLWGDDQPCSEDPMAESLSELDCDDCDCRREIDLRLTRRDPFGTSYPWSPVGWEIDPCEVFPNPDCTYIIRGIVDEPEAVRFALSQTTSPKAAWSDKCYNDNNLLITGNATFFELSEDETFAITNEDCWRQPAEVYQICHKFTNDSLSKYAMGSIEINTGSTYMINAEMCGWCVPNADLPLPCDNGGFWRGRDTDFWARMPELPSYANLSIDSCLSKSTLSLPGGGSEDAIGYVSTRRTGSFDYIEIPPCYTFYVMLSVDADTYNEDIEMSFKACKRTNIGTGVFS